MAAVVAPTLKDRRTKATFDLFKELGCLRAGDEEELQINDVGRLDVEEMMARALDCLAAVCEAQRVRVAQKKPLKLKQDGDALTAEQQAARNKVFRAALNAVAKGLTHDGAERDDLGCCTSHLLRAFPDDSKLTDGRGWLPMHWAIVADEDKESGVTETEVLCVHETDPMALRKHHLTAVTEAESSTWKFGYTPAHLLCGLKVSEKNMSLVRHFSMSDPRAFTMKVLDVATAEHSFSALHVACTSRGRSEALLRLLVQLDPSQTKVITACGGPLGLLCANSEKLDERQLGCLVEADSSTEVVHDGIRGCLEAKSTFADRVQTVAKLLEVNPEAAQHKGEKGHNLAHWACRHSDTMPAADCIEVLKLVLARHKDALKEAADDGMLSVHIAAGWGQVQVLDFVLGEYPGAAAVVDDKAHNLLHVAAVEGPDEHRAAKARLLCARYPAMMLQRNSMGYTPHHWSCFYKNGAMAKLLCEIGGREAASTAILRPTNAQYIFNGWLTLHMLIRRHGDALKTQPLSEAADAFRLLLRLYPEAAGTEGDNYKKTPYCLAVEEGLSMYYHRLLLRAAPDLDPAELRRLNWAERRTAMFVAFAAVPKQATAPPLLVRLRATDKELVKHVVSFL